MTLAKQATDGRFGYFEVLNVHFASSSFYCTVRNEHTCKGRSLARKVHRKVPCQRPTLRRSGFLIWPSRAITSDCWIGRKTTSTDARNVGKCLPSLLDKSDTTSRRRSRTAIRVRRMDSTQTSAVVGKCIFRRVAFFQTVEGTRIFRQCGNKSWTRAGNDPRS
jgi:hypothetical protein